MSAAVWVDTCCGLQLETKQRGYIAGVCKFRVARERHMPTMQHWAALPLAWRAAHAGFPQLVAAD